MLFVLIWDIESMRLYYNGYGSLGERIFAYATTAIVGTILIQEWIEYFVKKLRDKEEENGD